MGFKIVQAKNSANDSSEKKGDFDYLIETPKWTLDEVTLSQPTLNKIDEMIAYIDNRDKLLNEWEFNRFLKTGSGLSVNFFGKPGTGKSVTAEAIANKMGMSIIKANYGELESELVGKTSDHLMAVFETAEKNNSLLFFDEADAILSKRISNLSQAADYGVNTAKSTMLTLLDKFNGIIIFATNLFDNYDEAFLRRILFDVEFLPPDLEMREKLWRFHLSEKVPKEITYEDLATVSEGLCGGDIRKLTINLGLKLLTGKVNTIDKTLLETEIKNYREVKVKHNTKIVVTDTSNNGFEQNTSIKEE
ncbi:ATP-dependent zinc metalloprotease FtsH 2 [Microcystis aeruginosa Sj]|uniref:ATP-dependent zinc metalloprotease FtsH 2 n=1 Tax=Microcystis aeruginosa Sj TaxID=1979544 RepID=A0A2Z6UJI1_MICAE|nr:ATP-binding protein [Microcystis aeruginosa]GBL10087.1 ATP-dependent zinc metalloprotease FtsH 2 [Microcystis aeruginosa Sj]